ncbi:Hypothetical protein NGAL_HAMBI2427_62590 [Neorhizobium galegae bv. orientalis]|uniref:Uncharacterized protein n=2 Tax=Neorhizobium galegae TaxID=399 RepID=A0A068T2E3_NEOGA|nr:Hypothetical protein RG540_PA09790 [Neorhizobium galegae bv. orientalis str. HAMBI 540]CDZ55516.1 Hypothetical protein NGAL_HAMBI2427_62590 [Neorhizobium galegae bv. orientalis]
MGSSLSLIDIKDLEPDRYYWIRKNGADAAIEIGRVSTIFGKDREFWTVVTTGSETHHMLYDFEFLIEIGPPEFQRDAPIG